MPKRRIAFFKNRAAKRRRISTRSVKRRPSIRRKFFRRHRSRKAVRRNSPKWGSSKFNNLFGATPPIKFAKLRYYSCYPFDPDMSVVWFVRGASNITHKVNSPFDPNNAITGRYNLTATGYDVLARYYNQYYCISSTITVIVQQNSALWSKPLLVFLKFDDDDSVSNLTEENMMAHIQNNKAVYRTLMFNTQGTGKVVLRKKFIHRRDIGGSAFSNAALVTSGPPKTTYAHLILRSMDGSSYGSTPNLYVRTFITFNCVFSDPKNRPAVDLDAVVE